MAKAVSLYAGMWKDRTASSIMLKVWTGLCWAWVKVRTLGRETEDGFALGSLLLIHKDKQGRMGNHQVQPSTKMPKRKRDHVSLTVDTQIVGGMAPPTEKHVGWIRLLSLFLLHYACSRSSFYEAHTRNERLQRSGRSPSVFHRGGVSPRKTI